MQDPAFANDLVRERRGQLRFAEHFFAGAYPHVAWHTQTEQAAIAGAGPSIGGFQSPTDWSTLACALVLSCPVWTQDSDFFGTGVATWTTSRVKPYPAPQTS